MRFFNKVILSSIALASMVSSCKKVIEFKEEDLIGGDVALTSVANNESAIIGAYNSTQQEMDILLNATFSDEVQVAEFYNAGTTHEWQYGSTDVGLRDNYTAVTHLYRTIMRVNQVLAALPDATPTRGASDEAVRTRLRGEGLFLRAYSHFQLFRYYSGNYDPAGLAMPYMEVFTIDPQARIDMGTYFGKIKADIEEAKGLLPNNLADKFRVNRLTAVALQARVALMQREWADAITYSTEYINAIPLSPRNEFVGLWQDANSNETSWLLGRTANIGGRIGSLWRATSTKAASGDTLLGTITWRPSDELWGLYDQANDIRFSAYLIDEPILTKASRPSHLIHKYAGKPYSNPDENVAHAKMFRTGEMYLIRAEARAESGTFTGANSAESDINELRAARIDGYAPVTFASKQEAIDAIILERQKELAYEGHRFWDLKRYNLPVTRTGADAPTATAATLPAGNFRFLLPIPNFEIQANPLMEQNPGYAN
jgi:starch-binding outer membrane protein, SusD/RagB family